MGTRRVRNRKSRRHLVKKGRSRRVGKKSRRHLVNKGRSRRVGKKSRKMRRRRGGGASIPITGVCECIRRDRASERFKDLMIPNKKGTHEEKIRDICKPILEEENSLLNRFKDAQSKERENRVIKELGGTSRTYEEDHKEIAAASKAYDDWVEGLKDYTIPAEKIPKGKDVCKPDE